MANEIQFDEWIAELQRLDRENAEGHSVAEIGAALGRSDRTVLKYLHICARKGWLKVGHRTEVGIAGVPKRVPVYRIVKPTLDGKKKRLQT